MHPSPSRLAKKARPTIRLKIGDVLEGKYKIKREIGIGGMGIVYEAEHVSLNIKMAVKVLLPTATDVHNVVERFRSEARSAASIRHPNIVEVTDFGLTPDQRPFFVMEFLSGESLADRMTSHRIFSEREVVNITDQILGGLSMAHSRGIIHRDLKPENIFLVESSGTGETVKIFDFGIAKIMGGTEVDNADQERLENNEQSGQEIAPGKNSLTLHGVILGTPGYLAPEAASGKAPADARSDLFSLGVMMYEMLSGRQPFRGHSIHEILKATINNPLPNLEELCPEISGAMARLVHTSLAPNPTDRFANTTEFMRHLTAAAVGRIPEDARECVTELASPSIVPQAMETLPIQPGDQDNIPTMGVPVLSDSAPDVPSGDNTGAVKKISSISSSRTLSSRRSTRPAKNKLPLIIGAVGVLLVCAAATFFFLPENDPVLDETSVNSELKHGDKVVTIWLEIKPRGAVVKMNGVRTDQRPVVIPSGNKAAALTVSAPGYITHTRKITPDRGHSLKIELLKELQTTGCPEKKTRQDADF